MDVKLKEAARIVGMLNPDRLRSSTQALRDSFEAARNPKPTRQSRAQARLQAISDHISNHFGCDRQSVKELVELMEGPLPEPGGTTSVKLAIGAVVTMPSGLEDQRMIYNTDADGDALLLYARGDYAGFIEANGNDWRPATEEEVEKFITDTRELVDVESHDANG